MFDGVQIIVVLVIIVVGLVVVQFFLQFGLHAAILRLCRQHIRIRAGVGGHGHAGGHALKHHRAGGHHIQQHHDHQRKTADDKQALSVTDNKAASLFCFLCGLFRRLCGGFRGFYSILSGFSGLGCGVLLFNGALLLPLGVGIAGKLRVVKLRLFFQRPQVGLIRAGFGAGGAAVGLELMASVGILHSADAALGGFLQLMCALHAHIVILIPADLTMHRAQRRRTRRIPHRMIELGGRARLFPMHQLGRDLAALGVNDGFSRRRFPLGDFGLCLFQLIHTPVSLADGLFQLRLLPFFFGKQQARRTLAHAAAPPIRCSASAQYSGFSSMPI